MHEMTTGPWWVVAAASTPSIASGLWVFWQWWVNRGDKLQDHVEAREQATLRDIEAQRLALSRDQAELFLRLRTELERVERRLVEAEKTRDYAWDLARWWNQRAHELRHAGVNAQSIVAGLCAREGVEPPAWPIMDIPSLEDPL